MKRIIIGTAGHIDHGKTALVKAMTGVDTDRLKEEKKRGISIELGFAPLNLPNGQQAAIVDVPGHERFIRQMLAGASGMDLVLLIIAADEGIMPQTREHLDIIQLLGIERGVIVITKKDLVDEEWLMLVEEDITQYVADTPAAAWPVMGVSAVTGENIAGLLDLIVRSVEDIREKPAAGQARMPIDRVFTMTGFGTVVTGTLWSGGIRLNDILEVMPQGKTARVRTLQVHNHKVEQALAGQRVAVNLQGVEVSDVHRGNVLATAGSLTPTYRVNASLSLLSSSPRSLKNWARVRFHLGTDEVMGRIVLLEQDELHPKERGYVQIVLEKPIVAVKGDRYVLRFYSPVVTVGGGAVIDPNPPKQKRFNEAVLQQIAIQEEGTPEEILLQEMEKDPAHIFRTDELASVTGLEMEQVQAILADLIESEQVVRLLAENQPVFISTAGYEQKRDGVIQALADYHRRYPLRKGMPREEIRSRLFKDFPPKQFQALMESWQEAGEINADAQYTRLAGRDSTLEPNVQAVVDDVFGRMNQDKLSPPVLKEIIEAAARPDTEMNEIIGYLEEAGRIIKVSDGMYFTSEAIAEAKAKLDAHFDGHKELSLAEARDLWQNSRKYALPLMEYFDRIKYTRRMGDNRVRFGR